MLVFRALLFGPLRLILIFATNPSQFYHRLVRTLRTIDAVNNDAARPTGKDMRMQWLFTHLKTAFHRTRRFITAPTSVRHLSLFWASPTQSIYPHPTSWRSILILSTHLRLGLPSARLFCLQRNHPACMFNNFFTGRGC